MPQKSYEFVLALEPASSPDACAGAFAPLPTGALKRIGELGRPT